MGFFFIFKKLICVLRWSHCYQKVSYVAKVHARSKGAKSGGEKGGGAKGGGVKGRGAKSGSVEGGGKSRDLLRLLPGAGGQSTK